MSFLRSESLQVNFLCNHYFVTRRSDYRDKMKKQAQQQQKQSQGQAKHRHRNSDCRCLNVHYATSTPSAAR
jgi:hypothetical protein